MFTKQNLKPVPLDFTSYILQLTWSGKGWAKNRYKSQALFYLTTNKKFYSFKAKINQMLHLSTILTYF